MKPIEGAKPPRHLLREEMCADPSPIPYQSSPAKTEIDADTVALYREEKHCMNRAILAALCASLILPAAHLLGAPTPDSSTIGQNQGVQFPIAEAYIEVEAADLMRHKASALFDLHPRSGGEVNMAKYLAIKASWQAAEACIQFHGGFGFAGEYEVERKLRETRLYQVVPMSTNGILSNFGEHPLGLPRWF